MKADIIPFILFTLMTSMMIAAGTKYLYSMFCENDMEKIGEAIHGFVGYIQGVAFGIGLAGMIYAAWRMSQ